MYALIAITEIENIDDLIPTIIINDADVDKEGRKALINKEYTHIGLSHLEVDEEIFIILILSRPKSDEEKKEEHSENGAVLNTTNENNEIIQNDINKKENQNKKNNIIENKDNNEIEEQPTEIEEQKDDLKNNNNNIDMTNNNKHDTNPHTEPENQNPEENLEKKNPESNAEKQKSKGTKSNDKGINKKNNEIKDKNNKQKKPDKVTDPLTLNKKTSNTMKEVMETKNAKKNITTDNMNKIYFFTTVSSYNLKKYEVKLYLSPGDKEYHNFEYQQSEVGYGYGSTSLKYLLFYFKVTLPKKSSFYININYILNRKNYCYYSRIIESKNNSELLGNIQLYSSITNNLAYQLGMTNENFLAQCKNILTFYKADMKILNPYLDNYKPSNSNNMNVNDILIILKLFFENNSVPLFLKDLYLNKIFFPYSLSFELKSENSEMFTKLNSIIINAEIKGDKNNEIKRNLQNNLLSIYGYSFYKYNIKKFSELIKNEDIFRASISILIGAKLIKTNDLVKNKFLDENEVIPFIIENSSSPNDLKNIFQNFKKLEDALNSLNNHYDLFHKVLTKQESAKNKLLPWNWFSSADIEISLPKYSINDDLDIIFNLIEQYLEKFKSKGIKLINYVGLIEEIIKENYENSKLNNLFKIKEKLTIFHKDKYIERNMINDLNENIHDTGITLAIKNKFSNNDEIMNFIEQDVFYNIKQFDSSSKRNPNIFKNFDLLDEKKRGFKKFVELNMYSKFKKNESKKFYQIFLDKMLYLEHLSLIFELFPNQSLDEDFTDLLLNKIPNLYDLGQNKDVNQLYENMYILISSIISNSIKVSRFTDTLENLHYLDQKFIKEIYIYILSKNEKKITKNVIDEFSKFFINNLKNINAQGIYLLINACSKNVEFLKKIFDNIQNYTITLNDIYSPDISPNFELYELFVNNNYLNDINYIETEYMSSTLGINNEIYFNIKDLKISYLKISDLLKNHEQNFLHKLKIISKALNEENKSSELYNYICDGIRICNKKLGQINEINEYLETFEPRNQQNTKNIITNVINILREKNIVEIKNEQETSKIENFIFLIEKSKNLRFKNSIIFMKLYEESLKQRLYYDEVQLLEENIQKYNIIMKKIINYKEENFLNIENINIILELLKAKKDEIGSEMDFISNEFRSFLTEKNVEINSVKNNLIYFLNLKEIKEYLSSIHWVLQIFKNLSNNQNYQETDYSQKLVQILEELNSENIKSENVEKAMKILGEYNINIEEENVEDFNAFLIKIYGKEDEIKFCVGKTDQEIKALNERLQDRQSEGGNLQPEDFDDFIGCKMYVNTIIQSHFANDRELYQKLRENFKSDRYYIIKFNNYIEKYGEIKELYDDSLSDHSEVTKSLIKKLMAQSNINILKDGHDFKFNVEYNTNKTFDLKSLIELKNKSLFSQNMIQDDEEYKEQILLFKEIVDNIKKLCENVQKLIFSGYPSDIAIHLKIENNILKNRDSLDQNANNIMKKYKNLFEKFEGEIRQSYKKKPLMRFLYGPLFLALIESIKKEKEINFLLKAISNGKINQLPERGKYQIADNAEFSEIFNVINSYLEECLTLNNLTLENIFAENKMITKKVGLYRLAVHQDVEKNLLALYKQFTNNFPLSNTVLICNEHTTYEEILAFLYLSFRCQYEILFCLMGIEKLDSGNRLFIIKKIAQFVKEYGKEMISCLVIIYLKDSEIRSSLSKLIPGNKMIVLEDNNQQYKHINDNIEVFISERAGYGKSKEIKDKIDSEFKNYIYFPIGGDFTRKKIIQRLIDFKIPQREIANYVIHFDLSETDLIELVREILLKILILKKLDINEQIFYFGNELNLKIELPNGFYNYIAKFPILDLFQKKEIKKLLPLKINPNLKKIKDNPVFLVANTLQKYKEGKIGEENIDLDIDNQLSREQCELIIDEYLKSNENEYNYYQKNSFIKLLSEEFRMFKNRYLLDPDSFDKYDRNGRSILSKSRNQIIKSILDSSVFFTKGPYDNLIKSQSTSQESSQDYDEEKLNKQALESLEKTKDNVTFDSIPATLFLFNGDETSFTAITKQPKGTEEYKRFYDLINSQSIMGGKKYDLPDYSQGDHYFYLGELQKILGLGETIFDENEIKELNERLLKENKIEELDEKIYIPNPPPEDKLADRKLYMAKLAKLNGNYVYTRDNFIKSVIILTKIKASIPVILMGETGCGKTSLLKMLSIFMNKGSEKMKTLNIHAGTNEEDIINFMNEKVLNNIKKEFDEELNNIMQKFDSDEDASKYNRDKIKQQQEEKLREKKIWIFFDELNTCNSMGLISEIMCKRTMLGKPLPDNLIFLGAVNPYRTMTTKMKQSGLTYHGDNSSKASLLVYTVNPLPHTLMNYIFNFSSLSEREEREYIKSMIKQNITRFYPKQEDNNCQKLIQKTLDSICECHQFIRDNYDASSVSLREIRRFNIFFKFFIDYLQKKSKYKEQYRDTYDLLLAALNITIYLCYYLRISDKKIREELSTRLLAYFDKRPFLEIPNREVLYIAEQFIIDVDKGIALNRSLKENLFTSFVCIVNRIPLIIVGKPGEGKSLTIQTVNNTMKGIYSKSDLFKEYPQLFMYNYQGSQTSTSQGIIETFDKARAYAKNQIKRINEEAKKETNEEKKKQKKEKFIAMIFFDEMGLAERSPNNPLKAIHSQLEYDENEFKIAFVGISNWKIDASKMNRCLTLSKPDPDMEDLIHTADTIAKAMDNTLANNYKTLIEALALSYYEYKKSIANDESTENFHGNRDFYHLIKCAMRELKKRKNEIQEINKDKILTKIGLMSLTRNFGGLSNSLEIIKSKFAKIYTNYNEDENYSYNILECIKDNLYDYNSRFLMLVANSTIIKYLENVLDSQNKDYVFLTGSQFVLDKKAAEKGGGYSEDLLNKIQYLMSKDNVLILKNLEVIYPSLYELFNQNYTKIGDKYFSKIAFASSKSSSEVNRKFRVILLITQDQLNKMKVDPPLLNRFEKQIVSFKDSLNQNQIKLAEKISDNLKLIKTFNNKEKNLVYNLPELLINCTNDEIEGLIYKICNENPDKAKDEQFIEDEILKRIVPTFCQDIIASVKYSGFNKGKNAPFAKKIIQFYKEKKINNFAQFLQKIKKDKNVIYTFSHLLDLVISEEYKEVIVETIDSENTVEEIISSLYEKKFEYLIFRFTEKDLNKMNHLSYLINNYETKFKQQNQNNEIIGNNINGINDDDDENIINTNTNQNQNRHSRNKVIFLVHLTRKSVVKSKEDNKNKNKNKKQKNAYSVDEIISNLDDSYDQYFIDNLKSERNDFMNILDIKDSKELINSIIDFDRFLDKNLNIIMSYFDYNLMNKFSKIKLREYTNIVLTKLIFEKESPKAKLLRNYLIEYTKKNVKQSNIIPNVYTSKVFQNTDVDFFQVLATYMLSELSKKLLSVVTYIEKRGFFSSILINENNDEIIQNEIILRQIENVFQTMDIDKIKKPEPHLRANKINVITGLSIPCTFNWFNQIKIGFLSKQKISEKYILNENILRPRKELKNERKTTEKYLFQYNKLIEGMKEELSKNDNIREIFSSNHEKLKQAIYYDYLNIYCVEISEKFSNNFENLPIPINFIEIILQIKFNAIIDDNNPQNEIEFKNTYIETKEDFSLLNFGEIILFLEGYKGEIIFITEVFCLLSSYIPNTLEKVKEIIKSKIIDTGASDRNPGYKKRVNEVFYIMIESLLKSIYKSKEEISEIELFSFYPFFNFLKFIEATFNRINQKFLLYSNELYSLRNLISLYDIFKNLPDVKEILKNIMKIVETENDYLKNKDFEKLKENIVQIKNIIIEKLGKDSDILADYMSNLLRQQYRKVDDNNYKFELLKMAFETDELIERSLYFICSTVITPIPVLTVKKKPDEKAPNSFTFFTKEECEQYFLKFISKNKNERIYTFYENIESKTFTHVLLYYFELLANNYFNNIIDKFKNSRPNPENLNIKSEKECEELVLGQNLLYLKKALLHIDNVLENKNLEPTNLNNLGKLYSIAYIKLYIKHLAEIYIYSKDKIVFTDIIQIISGNNNESNFRKMVKIFFWKNCLQYFENYSKFNEKIDNDREFLFRKEYKDILEEQSKNNKANYILNDHFIFMKDFEEKYSNDFLTFTTSKNNNFEELDSLINQEYINNRGLDKIFCLLINHLISYYFSSEKNKCLAQLENFKNEFGKISNNLGLSQNSLTLLNMLLNIDELIRAFISKQNNNNNYSQEQFEIMMHALRFVLQTSRFNNNNFYNNLLTPQCKDYIANNYIPGALPFNNIFITTYYYLNDVLKDPNSSATGYYVCTCGLYYSLGNCTCPYGIFNCRNCNRQIGGTGHVLLRGGNQTDHWRVISKNEDLTPYAKENVDCGNIPCLFLDQFKQRYVDVHLNQQPKGIIKEDPAYFVNRHNKVRSLDELSFRLMNYLLYSHLFFNNLMGYLSDEDLSTFTHGEFTCIRMIEKNWEIIETILAERGINDVKHFINIIFDKIIELMSNIQDLSTIQKRQEFETSINNYIEELINNREQYDNEELKYNNYNEKIKGSSPQSLNEIISENYSPFGDLYDENDYPYLGLFLVSKYPDLIEMEKSLEKKKDYTQNYCLLNQVIICNEDYGRIENVVNINKLVNLLYQKYNNKIERDKAKTKKILECFDENENIEEIKKDLLIPYIDSWNKIKSKATNYLCRPTMPELTVTMEHTLIHFLPDDGEICGGMYLASAYKYFIQMQNEFVKTVIKSIGPDSILMSYLSQLNQEIQVQDANEEDCVKINSSIKKFAKDMIFQYSMRDIFKNGKIDFKEFKKSIKFDFDSIENELARKILPGVKLFVSDDANEPIKFISYLYETFRSNRSSIITNYNDKYPSRKLTFEEEKLLYSFIKEKKNKKQSFNIDIMSSCQILIDFIQKENFNKNKTIVSVIQDLPKYIEIDDLLKSFFIENTEVMNEINTNENNNNDINDQNIQMFSINTLINIYQLIEFLCWPEFKNNLNEQYKMHLTDEMKVVIKKVLDKYITEDSVLKKQDIANATRRLISRYLSGKRGDTDIDEMKKLFEFIKRADLWRPELLRSEENDDLLYNIFENSIRTEIKFITRCGPEKQCSICCTKKKEEGLEDPCPECDNCNGGLRIGHALEFYEFINDEVLDLDKFNINNQISSQISNQISNEIRTDENNEANQNRIEEQNEDANIINTNNMNEGQNTDNNQNHEEIEEEEVEGEDDINDIGNLGEI